MFPWVVALSLFASAAPGPLAQPSLEALAAASGRPRECSAPSAKKGRSKKPTVWQRARLPELSPYCDLLAKSHAVMEKDPKAALDLADQADAVWPRHAGALVARGRAQLALGKPKEALAALEQAQGIDKLSVEEPKAMRAHARALVLNGRLEEGAELYRTMVPRASLLSDKQRSLLLLEAALASMSDAARASAEPGGRPLADGLVEAAAFIGEARAIPSESTGDVLMVAALVHDRAGDLEKASVALAEAARVGAKPASPSTYVADLADERAIEALALERTDPAGAQARWTKYLEATQVEPFAASARARLAALKGSPGKPAKKPKKGASP